MFIKCMHPQCGALTQGGKCSKHGGVAWQDTRESAGIRGYDGRWHRLRNAYFRATPNCERCAMPGQMVHHRQSVRSAPELRYEWGNLETLCLSCHAKEHQGGKR
jgi:hypothetical protein